MKKRILCLILALLMGVSVLLVACDDQDKNPNAAFVPPPFDAAAVQGTPAVPEGLGWNELNANDVYKVSVCGVVKLQGDRADIWLTSPATNTVWLKVRVLNEKGETLGETGLIKPGEYVQSVTFTKLPKVGDKITMRVMSYQPDTYYSAGEIKLNTTVS